MRPARNSDAVARLQALDIERSWIVEAPAGSGKTGLLIQRYLCLLGDPKVTEPEQVLAITFTKAATAEIRERVVRELQRAHEAHEPNTDYDRATRSMASAVLERDHALGWRLLDEPRRLRIQTIDSVCAQIARSLPILSGGNGSLTPVEDPAPLHQEAARRTWFYLGGEDHSLSAALHDLLLHQDGNLDLCVSLVAAMLAQREQWGSLIPLREEDLTEDALETSIKQQLNHTLEQVICDALGRLREAFPDGLLRRLTNLAVSLSERPQYGNRLSLLAVCRELREPPTEAAEHLAYWQAFFGLLVSPSSGTWRKALNQRHLGIELTAEDRLAFKEVALDLQEHPELVELLKEIESLPPREFPSEQWPITKALLRVLRQALAELQTVFVETGQCDFVEPALLARYALSQSHGRDGLEDAVGTELKHLLVDEMQDTSIRQYDLLEHLTEGWASEQKTVFLVGDPKQSIYLFRHARVERFIETMRTGMLGKLPVGVLQLTTNFRSQAGLISAYNRDFSQIFPQTVLHPEDVTYVCGQATREKTPNLAGQAGAAWHLGVIHCDTSTRKRETQAQHRVNARHIRTIVEQWKLRPLPDGRTAPWRIAILVKSRACLASVLPELRREPPVSVRALKIDTLKERTEVLDLLALTRSLLHPADRTAWLAVLHAPWCGLSLSDLHILTGKDDEAFLEKTMMDLIRERGVELSADGIMRLERVWSVLDAAVRSSGRVRLPELVERTWRSLRGNTFLKDTALRNAETFLHLLRTIDQATGEVERFELERRLNTLFAFPEVSEGAVELVTIHQSKGLEWDVVLVPELERKSPHDESRLFEVEELLNGRVVLAPITAKGQEATGLNRWLRKVRSRREAAERKRLFYVACTRAREELHLFGAVFMQKNGSITTYSSSLLGAAWSAAESRFTPEVDMTLSPPSYKNQTFDLAATSEEITPEPAARASMLTRLPLSALPAFTPAPDSTARRPNETLPTASVIRRATGSFSARCLGTTVHTFLEEAATRLSEGSSPERLSLEISAWEPRIRSLLRMSGLPPSVVEQHLTTVLKALHLTLSDPVGRWLLATQSNARNEVELVNREDRVRHHRIDRVLRGGATPGVPGDTFLWLIDYKTSAYSGSLQDEAAIQEFLRRERSRHAPQLERYAKLFEEDKIRLALWFPLIGKLTWWEAAEETQNPA